MTVATGESVARDPAGEAAGGPPAGEPPGRADAPPRARRRLRGRVTPGIRLTAQAGAAAVLLALLGVLAVAGSLVVRGDVRELAGPAYERAAAASELRFALADLDAQRANTLVPGHAADDPGTRVGNREMALINAQDRRARISGLLAELAEDPATRARLQRIMDALGRYDALQGRVEYADDQEPNRPAGHPPRLAVTFSGQAGEVMEDDLLPEVGALAEAYDRRAGEAADEAEASARRWLAVLAVAGAALLAFLAWWQRDLARRYRRVLNPALLAATACALAAVLATAAVLADVADEVGTARDEGLRPWARSAQARAVSAETSALQSRWLTADGSAGALFRERFAALSEQLVRPAADGPRGGSYAQRLDAALERDAPLSGLLAPEGGQARDRAVLDRFATFHRDDDRLRSLVESGRLDEAAELLTEVPRGHLAFDFYDFSTRLDRAAAGRAEVFTARADSAGSALGGWPGVPGGLLAAGLVLVPLGVRPRLAEYR